MRFSQDYAPPTFCAHHPSSTNMSKKRKAGVLSGTAKKRLALASRKKAARKDQPASNKQITSSSKSSSSSSSSDARSRQVSSQAPINPFRSHDSVLLVGEGDFSFAASLRATYRVENITATCFDDEKTLAEKYPQAAENICKVLTPLPPPPGEEEEEEEEGEGEGEEGYASSSCGAANMEARAKRSPPPPAVHYSVDATKLSSRRALKTKRFSVIAFQFPHVGGATKSQDRQVLYNQQLLLGFFKSAKPLLSPKSGIVVVTLFDGLPYELWNVRALAKEAGLVAVTSSRFDAGSFPGYKHARTLGNIEGGGGWKGEERKARMYIFGLPEGKGKWEVVAKKTKSRPLESAGE
jgi:25S rRNA (uracil2634-N3)-methyltransferase